MNIYHDSMMVEDPLAVTYNAAGFIQSPTFRDDRLSIASSQHSLASQTLTNSGSLLSSPRVPATPETATQNAQIFHIPDGFGQPHMVSDTEGLELTYNRHEDAAVSGYDTMANFNMIGDNCWKLDAMPEVPAFTGTTTALADPELAIFDGIALTANNSLPPRSFLPAEISRLDLNSHALDLSTERNHLRTFLPYSNCLPTEDKSFDSLDLNKKILRSHKPRCREEKLKFRQETTASKFPAYEKVEEKFRSYAAIELSRMKEIKTESLASPPLSPLSSSSGTRTTRTRRRNQTASRKITLPSEKADVSYIAQDTKTKKFFCEVCNNGYTRKEHMERHKKNHFGQDNVRCYIETCDTIVGRKDNLIQHLSTHVRVAEKGSRSPDKMIPVEEMRSLIRLKAGKAADRMVLRLNATRRKMKMKDYLEKWGHTEGVNSANVSRGIRDYKVLSKL